MSLKIQQLIALFADSNLSKLETYWISKLTHVTFWAHHDPQDRLAARPRCDNEELPVIVGLVAKYGPHLITMITCTGDACPYIRPAQPPQFTLRALLHERQLLLALSYRAPDGPQFVFFGVPSNEFYARPHGMEWLLVLGRI